MNNKNNEEKYTVKAYNNDQKCALFWSIIPEKYPIENIISNYPNIDISLISITQIIHNEDNLPIEFNIIIYDSNKWQVKEYISSINENKITTKYISTKPNYKINSKTYLSNTFSIPCENQEQILRKYHLIATMLTNKEKIKIKTLAKKNNK